MNNTTGAQRTNARQDKIWDAHKKQQADKANQQTALNWGAYDSEGKLRAILESESEAYFYVRNRGHMHGGTHRKIS